MILRYHHLTRHPAIFRALTGLTVAEFAALAADVLPAAAAAAHARLTRSGRLRALGGGRKFGLSPRDHLLLAVVWLRRYPINAVLGSLFGVSEPPARRAVGRDTLRLPDPGRGRRPGPDALLADTYYSGKKKRHTRTVQVAVDEASVRGPTADLAVLRASGLLARLPPGVGALGDLASVGIAAAHPTGLGATPRRKPRGRLRPPEDVAYNRAFTRRRVTVEHTIGCLRRYEALTRTDRHHRRGHTARVGAVVGRINRQLRRHRA